MKYSLCIESFYNNLPFEEKFAAAKRDGFEYCEFWTWQNRNWESIKKAVADSGIKVASFSGDDEFSLINPDENSMYSESDEKAVEAIKKVLI